MDNPFWIYPLDIIEIKLELSQFSKTSPQFGVKAHMNVLISITDEQEGKFLMHKFYKCRDLPFKYSQFIKFKLNRHVKQAYNVVISQTIPILYLSNDSVLAMQESRPYLTP